MGVVKSPPHKFCLFLVGPEGKDLGHLVNGHLIVGENRKNQSGAYLVVEVLGKDSLQVLTLFLLEVLKVTRLNGRHFDILFMLKEYLLRINISRIKKKYYALKN
jgi:hypothetical protein